MDSEQSQERDWFREGNIQERVIEYLEDEEGFTILSPGHSFGSEQGLEIVAERNVDGVAIHRLVMVLGWPSPVHEQSESRGLVQSARPEATARSWIAQTLLDLALGRGDSPDVEL